MHKPKAMLLVGPTGSGKTPLGDGLEQHGLWGRRCHHFDFGEHLRVIAAGQGSSTFTPGEVGFVRGMLETGVLLEDARFALAAHILEVFLSQRQPGAEDLLVLNGLPRHVGQARAIARMLDVICVVCLDCEARVVGERLGQNSGGDRSTRTDDQPALVAQKLKTFAERTGPLVEHYRNAGTRILHVHVELATQASDLHRILEAAGPAMLQRTGS